MPEEELSKRIDDLHKRLDDFRGDVNTRFTELREDMNTRFTELREDMNARFGLTDRRLTTLTWIITAWFSLLTLLTILFKFIRF